MLNVRSAKVFGLKLSGRIQKTGKLGFGEKVKQLMGLDEGVSIAFLSDNEETPITHIAVYREANPDAFELRNGKTKFPYVDTKQLFDFYKFDYTNKNIYLEFTRESVLDSEVNAEVYRVNVRIQEKSNNENIENDETDMQIDD